MIEAPRGLVARYWRLALLGLVWAAPLPLMQIPAVRHGVVDAATWMREGGSVSIAVYVAVYCFGALFGMPSLLMSSVAGFAWGPIQGALIAVPTAATASATTYVVARLVRFARPPDVAPTPPGEKPGKIVVVQRLLASADFKTALLIRMSPLLPQNLITFSLAFSGVRLYEAFFATLLGHGPMTCLHAYIGSIVANADELVNGKGHLPGPAWLPFALAGVTACTISLSFALLRKKVRAASEAVA